MVKTTQYNLLITSFIFACKAQNPIVNIDASRSATPDGAYFKDINNEFDKFTGIWEYSDGNNTFTIELKKIEMIFNGKDYEDKLVGEYRYLNNGFEMINTLSNINNYNPAKHNISGRRIIDVTQEVTCTSCSPGERRVMLYFDDPARLYLSNGIILRYMEGEMNPEKLQVTLYATSGILMPYEGAPEVPRVPLGTYIMEKQ